MITRYSLKYGDEYEDSQLWFQFKMVLDGACGRRNFLIYRVFAALINELKISDCDEYRMINEIERWANDRLKPACRPRPVVRSPDELEVSGDYFDVFINEDPPDIRIDGEEAEDPDEEERIEAESTVREQETVTKEQPKPQSAPPGLADLFSGMKKVSFNDINNQ